MYESPIIINTTLPFYESISKAQDEYIIRACQKVGVDVNKEELIKALQYDRSQYEKGYADGLAYKPPVETNADRIRAMPDEKLAEWLAKSDPECDPPEWWLCWLRQEANDGNN